MYPVFFGETLVDEFDAAGGVGDDDRCRAVGDGPGQEAFPRLGAEVGGAVPGKEDVSRPAGRPGTARPCATRENGAVLEFHLLLEKVLAALGHLGGDAPETVVVDPEVVVDVGHLAPHDVPGGSGQRRAATATESDAELGIDRDHGEIRRQIEHPPDQRRQCVFRNGLGCVFRHGYRGILKGGGGKTPSAKRIKPKSAEGSPSRPESGASRRFSFADKSATPSMRSRRTTILPWAWLRATT